MGRQIDEWTLKEAAEYEGCSLESVRRWIRNGDLSYRAEYNPITRQVIRYVNMREVMKCASIMRRNSLIKKVTHH